MKAVTDNEMPANHAARIYPVPTSTLKDRLSGRVVHGKIAPQKKMSWHLIWLSHRSYIGYGKTIKDVKHIVERVALDNTHTKIICCK